MPVDFAGRGGRDGVPVTLISETTDVRAPASGYDVVVIGGGVGGLVSAALLGRAGRRVAVLEMADQPGGYLAGYRRGGFRFDASLHWLNQCGEDGFVRRVFRAIGPDYPPATPWIRIRGYPARDRCFVLTHRPDELRDELIAAFPREAAGLRRFFRDARALSDAFARHTAHFRDLQTRGPLGRIVHGVDRARVGFAFLPHLFYSGDRGVERGLRRYFRDEGLLGLWAAQDDILSCLIPIAWAYRGDYQHPPAGGGRRIPEWLVRAMGACGNAVHCRTRALRILANGREANGVVALCDGRERLFRARHVVAACDVETLYDRLLPPGTCRPGLRARLRNAVLHSSAVTLAIGLDCPAEALGLDETMRLVAEDGVSRAARKSGDPHTGNLCLVAPSVCDKSLAPEGKGTLVVFAPAYFHQFDTWGTTRDAAGEIVRGARYRQVKQAYAEIMLDRVERALGRGIRSHIAHLSVATPITHYRYTGNREGSMMGARPVGANYRARIAHYRTPLRNVWLTGHWASVGGGVPMAVATAANSTLLLLQQEHRAAARALGAYFDGALAAEALDRHPAWQGGTRHEAGAAAAERGIEEEKGAGI